MKRKKKYKKNKPPKRRFEKYTDGLRQKLLDQDIPVETFMQDVLVTAVGHKEIWVENYRAILEYKETEVLLQAGNHQIRIDGDRLKISHYMEEHMMIYGNIRSITYL